MDGTDCSAPKIGKTCAAVLLLPVPYHKCGYYNDAADRYAATLKQLPPINIQSLVARPCFFFWSFAVFFFFLSARRRRRKMRKKYSQS